MIEHICVLLDLESNAAVLNVHVAVHAQWQRTAPFLRPSGLIYVHI